MKRLLAALMAIIMIPLSAHIYFADEISEQVSTENSVVEETEQVSKDKSKPKKLVALGDSITRGYGLSDGEKSYVEVLTDKCGFESNNFAVNGRTSVALLESLQKPAENEKQAIEQADYIVISIGGNDMLYLLNNLVDGALSSDSMSNPNEIVSNLINMANELTPENIKSDVIYYKNTVEKIIKILQDMNPDAEIIMQTVYDPFKPIFVIAPVVFPNIENDINNAHTKVDDCINSFNSALFELSENYGFKIADVSKDFRESDKKYLNMSLSNPDIHPNVSGHRRIAEIVKQTMDPDNTIFTSAFVESSSESSIESYTKKSTDSKKFSTRSDETVENSKAANASENGERDYNQRLIIFVGVMAVISFVITFSRLKRKKK